MVFVVALRLDGSATLLLSDSEFSCEGTTRRRNAAGAAQGARIGWNFPPGDGACQARERHTSARAGEGRTRWLGLNQALVLFGWESQVVGGCDRLPGLRPRRDRLKSIRKLLSATMDHSGQAPC